MFKIHCFKEVAFFLPILYKLGISKIVIEKDNFSVSTQIPMNID